MDFTEHLERASKTVASWPPWMQTILGGNLMDNPNDEYKCSVQWEIKPPEKEKRLTEIFLLSSRYEWMFWEMAWKGESQVPGIFLQHGESK